MSSFTWQRPDGRPAAHPAPRGPRRRPSWSRAPTRWTSYAVTPSRPSPGRRSRRSPPRPRTTRSRSTPTRASATTAAWTCCAATAGRATARCRGSTSPTAASSPAWPCSRSPPGRSARTPSGSAARSSCATPAPPRTTSCSATRAQRRRQQRPHLVGAEREEQRGQPRPAVGVDEQVVEQPEEALLVLLDLVGRGVVEAEPAGQLGHAVDQRRRRLELELVGQPVEQLAQPELLVLRQPREPLGVRRSRGPWCGPRPARSRPSTSSPCRAAAPGRRRTRARGRRRRRSG